MGLTAGTRITDIKLDRIFIGSCTNGRIEDLRAAAKVVAGKHRQWQPQCDDRAGFRHREGSRRKPKGSTRFSWQGRIRMARAGLFDVPGDEPRQAGNPEERCASTSNRNFEGRQGFKGRTHLVSPAMAAAAAIAGHFVDIREWR